jgi:polysaccharide biosynthesis/export protein
VRFATKIIAVLMGAGIAAASHAQFMPPRPGEAPGASPQIPAMQTAPVQTPTITNTPPPFVAPAAKPAAEPQPAAESRPTRTTAEPRNEFQRFIETSTGQRLPIFGQNLFEDAPSTFAPVENIPVPNDYVIGPGDELMVRAWGQIDVDYRAVVDRNGTINIPRVGSINVAGIKYNDLTDYVRTAVARNFRNFDILVTLGQLRAVQVFVVGYARRPGSYTVSSLSTLVNAIFAAGGPSAAGSMRSVQLKRGTRTVTEMDMYDLLLLGDKSKDAALLPGDVIVFLPIGPLAAVSGSVNQPAIFELKGQTSLGTLVGYAGGMSTTAQSRQATIERIDNRNVRVVEQVDLDFNAAQRAMKDGDLVSVISIVPKFENAVTLRGNVATPLRYPHRPGMRIRDLIPDKDALITRDYHRRQNLAVRTDTVTQGQLSANVRQLADEINWDYAVIERQNKQDLSTSLIPFNLGKVVLENDAAHNLALEAGDIVTVFSKSDVAAPAARRPVVVRLEGEFNFAGVYQAQPKETLRQLVARVGGVTPRAYLFGAEFNRESTRREQEERLRKAVDQLEQDVQRAAVTRAQSVVSAEDAASLKQESEAQRSLVTRLRTLKPTGRIVLQMPQDPKLADIPDIALEDGDRLYVPQEPSQVSVFGTVFNESSFLYSPDKNVADYLSLAGGPRKQADKSSMYVLRADGSVVSARQSGFLTASVSGVRLMPGDAIVVPEDFERTTWTKDLKDWTQIFYQFGLGAAALKVISE